MRFCKEHVRKPQDRETPAFGWQARGLLHLQAALSEACRMLWAVSARGCGKEEVPKRETKQRSSSDGGVLVS